MAGDALGGVMLGAGFFAGFQAEAWSRLPAADIRAVVDPELDKAQEFARRHGIPAAYRSLEDACVQQKPDFVDVVTRPETHLDLVKQAADFGCHVICQKPMAPTMEECEAMSSHCERAGVRLLIHENWRWQPWYREIKRLAVSESLGNIFRLHFQVRTGDGWGDQCYTVQPYFRDMERLLVYETLVHHIDTARHVAGEMVNVCCRTQRINSHIAGEDCATIQLELENGGEVTIDANRINGPVPAPMIFGTALLEAEHGAIRLDSEARLWVTRYGKAEEEHVYTWSDHGYRGDSVFATQSHLLECLINGTPAETEAKNYLKTVAIVEACYESADQGGTIALA